MVFAATLISLSYVAAAITLSFIHWPTEGLHPNEWGDLAAGVTSPLALLWFLVTLHLQSKELQLAREVARRQADETAALAESQKQQAEATAQLLEQAVRTNATATLVDDLFDILSVAHDATSKIVTATIRRDTLVKASAEVTRTKYHIKSRQRELAIRGVLRLCTGAITCLEEYSDIEPESLKDFFGEVVWAHERALQWVKRYDMVPLYARPDLGDGASHVLSSLAELRTAMNERLEI